jgi:hypothetical protein
VRRLAPVTLAALALALPASAAAQGAGDEQYKDPFGGQQPKPAQPQAPADQGAEAGATPTQAPQTPSPTAAAPAPAQGELPRTGYQGVVLLIAYGWALLVGGAALRRLA